MAKPDDATAGVLTDLAAILEEGPGPDGGPRQILKGTFTVYATPDKGLHIAYRTEGAEEDGHMPIPAGVIRLAMAAASGRGPLAMITRLMP
jgi:hypothetical protein